MSGPTLALVADAAALHTRRVALGLKGRGYDITIYTPHGLGTIADIPVVPIGATDFLGFRRRLARADLVNVQCLTNSRRYLFLRGLPRLAITPWGSDLLDRPDSKIPAARRRWCRIGLHAAQAILPTSRYMATQVHEIYHVPEERITPILWGPDPARFDPGLFPAPRSEPFTIGFFKHLHPYYGATVLIEALAFLRQQFDGQWRCLMYGAGPITDEVRARIATLGLTDRVTLVGRIRYEDIPARMAECHVVVSPSVVDEALGMASLEAQMLGIPVINSDLGGMPETCDPSVSGMLVPPGDPAALAAALATLASDPAQRAVMGLAALAFIRREGLDWNTTMARTDAVLRGMLGS